MNRQFTEKLGEWLQTPPDKRDWGNGALMLLQLSGNKILYRNVMANLAARHDVIEYNLQKYYNFRVRELTSEQVKTMEKTVEKIVERNISLAVEADEAPARGRRADHDELPDNIKALYVENLALLRKMRENHLQLRKLSLHNAPCPNSERYPFLQEIIKLDKKIHANWKKYDEYSA